MYSIILGVAKAGTTEFWHLFGEIHEGFSSKNKTSKQPTRLEKEFNVGFVSESILKVTKKRKND